MDIRIDGKHERALLRLMEHNAQKTAVAMTRILIQNAAQEIGYWPPQCDEAVSQPQPAGNNPVSV